MSKSVVAILVASAMGNLVTAALIFLVWRDIRPAIRNAGYVTIDAPVSIRGPIKIDTTTPLRVETTNTVFVGADRPLPVRVRD